MKTITVYLKLLFSALGLTIFIVSIFAVFKTIIISERFVLSEIIGNIASMLFKSAIFFICFLLISILLILFTRFKIIREGKKTD